MKRKIFTLCTALILGASTVFASNTAVDGIYYNFDDANLTASVTYRGDDPDSYTNEYTGDVVIPATVTYDGQTYSVTSIGEYAFYDCSGLTSVTIPNSVTNIGDYAFNYCSGLTSVTIPNSVMSISTSAFYSCSSLTSVVWNAKNCADFSSSPFSSSSITSFTFGNAVEHIPAYLCYGLSSLISVTIPNSVTSIGSSAFCGCSGLTSVTIPNSVTSIEHGAFADCSGLTSVTIPNSVTSIGRYAFSGCSGLTSVTIGNSVESIGEYAFSGCSGLTSVVWNAKNYADFSDSNDAPFYDYDSASQITSFTFGEEVEHIPAYLCYGLSSLNAVTIPNSVTSIGDYAFCGCSGLTSVTIPNSVTSIEHGAFAGCSGLTSVTIPNSVTSIGRSAFSDCSGLTKTNYTGDIAGWCGITFEGWGANPTTQSHNLYINNVKIKDDLVIPDGVTSIGNFVFEGCSDLTSVTIPNSVTSIGRYAFFGCRGVTKFICKGTPTFANDDALTNFPKLDSIAVPAEVFDIPETELVNCPKQVRYIKITSGELSADAFSVIQRNYKVLNTLDIAAVTNTTLADEAFKGCYALESLSLPSELQTIGYMALADCKNLQSIHVPASVNDIDDSAFEDCRSVTSITFGDAQQSAPQQRSVGSAGTSQLRRIGNWGFYNCHNLQSLTIPEGVEKIGTAAFYGCTYLEELSLPSTVQSIGDNCFALASKLTKITVNAVTPPTIEAKTFAEVDRTIPVVVPAGALEAYTAADYWSEFINIEEAPVTAIAAASIIAGLHTESGRIVCEGEFRIYDLLGRDVTHLNGSLCGVYVVKSGNAAVKVVVK